MSCGGVSELVIERRIGLANSIGGLCRLRGSTTATGNATATTTATPANATTKEVSMGKAGAGAPSGDKNASTTSSTGKDLTVAQAPAPPSRPTKPCCFCWCCCCSCSCLAVKNVDENGPTKKTENSDLLNCDGEPPPSLDEIRSWGKSFDKLMRSSAGRKVFRDFLRCEYSEENILFWLACEELKRETNPDVVEEKARKIYEDYISILSPKEVSLDSRVREIVNRNMVEPTPHTFDEAQLQIYTLMHRDSYPRFVNSSLFKTLAQLNSSGASDAGSNADPAEQSSQSQSQQPQAHQSSQQQPHNNDNKKGSSEEVNPSTGIVVADVTATTSTTTAAITAAPTTTVSLTSNTNG